MLLLTWRQPRRVRRPRMLGKGFAWLAWPVKTSSGCPPGRRRRTPATPDTARAPARGGPARLGPGVVRRQVVDIHPRHMRAGPARHALQRKHVEQGVADAELDPRVAVLAG